MTASSRGWWWFGLLLTGAALVGGVSQLEYAGWAIGIPLTVAALLAAVWLRVTCDRTFGVTTS